MSGILGARICMCACSRLGRPARIALLAADVFEIFTKNHLHQLIKRHGYRRGKIVVLNDRKCALS